MSGDVDVRQIYGAGTPEKKFEVQGGSSAFIHTVEEMTKGSGSTDPSVLLDAFFASFSKTSKPLPTDFDSFYDAFAKYMTEHGRTGIASKDALLQAFVTDFASQLNIGKDHGWILVNANINTPEGLSDCKKAFAQFFHDFSAHYSYSSDGHVSGSPYAQGFFDNLSKVLTVNTSIEYINGVAENYRKIFVDAFPNALPGAFEEFFKLYYRKQIQEHGYFLPTQAADEWRKFIQEPDLRSLFDPTSLRDIDAHKTAVLDKILRLLAELLEVMQGVAAVQSETLQKKYTALQNAWTERIADIHIFVSKDGSKIDDDSENSKTKRAELNDQINSNYREIMSAKRSMVMDRAKVQSSNIQQTSDVVSNLGSMFTAIIQELVSMLSSIFRK